MKEPEKSKLQRTMWQRGCKDCRYFIRSLQLCSRGIENCILLSESIPVCEQCYWWDKRREACSLNTCAYRNGKRENGSRKAEDIPECDGCPYKTDRPCVGVCMQNVLQEWKKVRVAIEKAGDAMS